MKRISPDAIREHLRLGYGMRDYYEFLHKSQQFLYTGDVQGVKPNYFYGDDDIPSYPDIKMDPEVEGRSRGILDALVIAGSKVMSADPLPKWEEVSAMTAEFRTEAFLKRYREMRMDRETGPAWMDGAAFGVGATLHGWVSEGDTQKVDAQHIPAQCVAWDPLVQSPEKSSWVAITLWLHPDEAAVYGDMSTRKCSILSEGHNHAIEAVRIVMYWHRGDGIYEPTYAVFAGPISHGPVVHRSNPWGNEIPLSFMVGHILPGMPRPVGSVYLQAPLQIMQNLAEDNMNSKFLNGGSMDLVNLSKIDQNDFNKWKKGQQRFVRVKAGATEDPKTFFQRLPADDIAATTLQLLQYYNEKQVSAGGASQLETGQPAQVDTATEAQILAQQIQQNQGTITRQTALYMSSFVRLVCEGMKIGDRTPMVLEYEGDLYNINDPDVPELWLDQIFARESMVSVDADNLTSAHNTAKRRARANDLIAVYQLTQGAIPAELFLEEVLMDLGLTSFWERIQDRMQQMQQQMPQMDPNQAMGQGMPPTPA